MSHCANYLLRFGGELYRGNTRWGSKSLLAQLAWGPHAALEMLADVTGASVREESDDPPDTIGWVYDELMCEGAVFADYDERRLTAFGGEDIRYSRTLQLAYLSILERTWPRWDVRYAFGGWPEVARAAGLEPELDEARDRAPIVLVPIALSPAPATHAYADTAFVLVTIVDADVRHYHVRGGSDDLWHAAGDSVLALAAHPPATLVEATNFAGGGLLVDVGAKRVHYWSAQLPSSAASRLAQQWPGYALAPLDGGVLEQIAATGEEPARIALRMDFVCAPVAEELARDASGIATLIADIATRALQPNVTVAAGALASPPVIAGNLAEHLAAVIAGCPPGERMQPRNRAQQREAILRRFHAAHPGLTSRVFERTGSYAQLAAIVRDAERVLDLACGDGPLLALLGAGAVGVDISRDELAAARARLPGATLVHASARALPFPAASFDACACHLAFMLFDDIETVVAELHRVLVPGGTFAALIGGGPVEPPPEGDAYHRFLAIAGARFRGPPLGDPRAKSEAGWRALFADWTDVAFERIELELGGSFEDAWGFLGGSYALFGADTDAVRAELHAVVGDSASCRVACYLARASRR